MIANTKSPVLDGERGEAVRTGDAVEYAWRRTVAESRHSRGHSLLELLIVFAMIGVLGSLALPQLIAERRLTRSVGVTREILSQLRLARQLAMSQRQAVTFQYNDATKQVSIIDHNINLGADLLRDPSYPNTALATIVSSTPLAEETSLRAEITYGIPSGLPTAALADGISLTPLFNSQINITFQPDGSVIDDSGNPFGQAMFIFNNRAARATASAISVMGASGRVKVWRYNSAGNAYEE